jgi:FkbM family methyltransferase
VLSAATEDSAYRYVQAAAKAWDIRVGSWTEPELALLPFIVRPGDTVLDLGANFGLYSYHLSRRVGRQGRVYAFEPVPSTHATCRFVLKWLRARNVVLVPKGCSDRSADVVFQVPLQASGHSSAGQAFLTTRDDAHEGWQQQVKWKTTREVAAQVVALDEFLPSVTELSLIKADVEGAELLAFRGAEQTISRHLPNVICEINPWFLAGFGLSTAELVGFFDRKGYSLYRLDDSVSRLKLRPTALEDIVEDNYVFVHPRRRDRLASLID